MCRDILCLETSQEEEGPFPYAREEETAQGWYTHCIPPECRIWVAILFFSVWVGLGRVEIINVIIPIKSPTTP